MLEILHNSLNSNDRVRSKVHHFLHGHQFHHIWEMQVAGAIYRPHAAYADHILNDVTVNKRNARLKLLARGTSCFWSYGRSDLSCFQRMLLFLVRIDGL